MVETKSETSGLIAAQRKSQAAATAARGTNKSGYKKVALWGAPLLGIIAAWVYHIYFQTAEEVVGSQTPKVQRELNPAASKGLKAKGVESLGQQTLTLQKGEISKPLRVQGNNCIWWFGEDPDGNTFTVEVRDINEKVWYTWENWVVMRDKGEVKNPGWFRFIGNQTNAFVGYEIREAGQCD